MVRLILDYIYWFFWEEGICLEIKENVYFFLKFNKRILFLLNNSLLLKILNLKFKVYFDYRGFLMFILN